MRRVAAPIIAFVLLAVVVFTIPAYIGDFRAQQLAYVAIYAIGVIGLNVLTGYTGQISLGHGAFMAIGGYTTAILMVDHGVKDIWTLPIAGLVAGVAGFLFGIPALRLSGLYLALATFAIAVATPSVIKRFEGFTGGGTGLNMFGIEQATASVAPVEFLGFTLTFNDFLYVLCWSVALVLYVVAWLFLRGRTGRAFRSVRDSETAAMSFGVSLPRYKTLAFGVSAFYAGVAGGLFAIANTFVNPDMFPVALSIFLLIGVVVAGLGSLVGIVFGAILIQFLPLWAQGEGVGSLLPNFIVEETKLPGAPAMIYGAVLILLMFVLPTGVSGLVARVTAFARRRYHRAE